MPLYTFLLEYRGGTYVSQVRARSLSLAIEAWTAEFMRIKVPGLGLRSKSDLAEKILRDAPTTVDGLINTWCSSALVRGHLALIHFTQTEE